MTTNLQSFFVKPKAKFDLTFIALATAEPPLLLYGFFLASGGKLLLECERD
jgi:hypothetical protein